MKDITYATLAAVCVLAVIAAPVSCSNHKNNAIVEMVRAGAHPIDAMCSISADISSTNKHAACVLRAAGKSQEAAK